MNKKITIFLIFLTSLAIFKVSDTDAGSALVVSNSEIEEIVSKKLDPQAEILANYLAQFDSPLQYHAQDFVDAARVYGLDWKMLPAIAGVESTFGKHIPGGYNAWGWGVYGDQAIYFSSWREGIFTLAKGLKENYINKGLTQPYSMNRVYAASPHWGGKVTYFMQDLDKFGAQFSSNKVDLSRSISTPKIAAISGELVLP